MKIEIVYNLASLHSAAAYIWDYNPFVRKWPSAPGSEQDVVDLIYADMVKYAKLNAQNVIKERKTKVSTLDDWHSYTGTGGYYIMFDLHSTDEDEHISIGVDVLVDPGMGVSNARYVTDAIDITAATV